MHGFLSGYVHFALHHSLGGFAIGVIGAGFALLIAAWVLVWGTILILNIATSLVALESPTKGIRKTRDAYADIRKSGTADQSRIR
jgi:hypothetical protein